MDDRVIEKRKFKKKKENSRTRVHGTQVACEVLEFMELEFLEKIQVELEFHELKYFIKFQKKKKLLSPRSL